MFKFLNKDNLKEIKSEQNQINSIQSVEEKSFKYTKEIFELTSSNTK